MNSHGAVTGFRRRSRAEAARLISEFEQNELRRREFCVVYGLSEHTLDAWRKRIALCESEKKIVPVEIVEDRRAATNSRPTASTAPNGQFRVVLAGGLRVEVESGFDAFELRRLIVALDGRDWRGSLPQPV